MKEQAKVIEIKNGMIILKVDPAEACSKCCKCGAAKPRILSFKEEEFKNIKPGDTVSVEVKTSRMMKVYLLLYGLPLVVFAGAIILIYMVLPSPIISFLGSMVLTSIAFFAAGYFIKRDPNLFPTICSKASD